MRHLLPLLLASALSLAAAEPVRIVVLSRYSSAIQEAEREFVKRYGKGLIEVESGETSVAPERLRAARVIVLHYLRG